QVAPSRTTAYSLESRTGTMPILRSAFLRFTTARRLRKLRVLTPELIVAAFVMCGASTNTNGSEDLARRFCKENTSHSLWQPGNAAVEVTIDARYDDAADGCFRRLEIAEHSENGLKKVLYSEEMAEAPVATYPYSDRLITLWESGSANWIAVYRATGGKV